MKPEFSQLPEIYANAFVAEETTLQLFQGFPEFDMTEVDFTPPDLVSMGILSKMKIAAGTCPREVPGSWMNRKG